MYVTICGRFCLNEGGAAGCVNRMKAKYHAKWGVQIAGMIFQTRSRFLICDLVYTNYSKRIFPLCQAVPSFLEFSPGTKFSKAIPSMLFAYQL